MARAAKTAVVKTETVEELPDSYLLCRRAHRWDQEHAHWEIEWSRGRAIKGVEIVTCDRCTASKHTPYDLVDMVQDGHATMHYPGGYLLEGQGIGGKERNQAVRRERLTRVLAGRTPKRLRQVV